MSIIKDIASKAGWIISIEIKESIGEARPTKDIAD